MCRVTNWWFKKKKHFRQNKIIEVIHSRYTWPSIWVDVKSFCNSYIICMKSKPQYYKLYRLLKQLLISKWLWNLIFIDFIKKLFFSSSCDIILVIVTQLSKQTIFVSTVNIITLHKLAILFTIYIFFKHGISSHITSDYKSEFVLNFLQSLGTALNMWIYFTSRYHPKGDS